MKTYPLLLLAISAFFFPAVPATPEPVASEQCAECAIYIPNAFSPNGDARNDAFNIYPEAACSFSTFAIKLYDRWGNVFFESEDPNFSWDGTIKNEDAPAAVYFYIIQYRLQDGTDSNTETIAGDVALLRP
mgnify:FL=1